jgi:hypothetical protein
MPGMIDGNKSSRRRLCLLFHREIQQSVDASVNHIDTFMVPVMTGEIYVRQAPKPLEQFGIKEYGKPFILRESWSDNPALTCICG